MSQPLQLRVPTPCQEHWTNMLPAEKGRHCAACQKIVVDFTVMSDPEIIRYMAQASQNVCGRLAPGQLNRNLAWLPPPQRNGWSGWRWLLAGLLMTSNDQEHHRPVRSAIHEQRIPPKPAFSDEVVVGMLIMPLAADTEKVDSSKLNSIVTRDSSGVIMGDIVVVAKAFPHDQGDSIQGPQLVPKSDSKCAPDESPGILGKVSISVKRPADSVKQFEADTLTALNFLPKVDSVKQFIKDTLTALHPRLKKDLTVYPNPVLRGTTFTLFWRQSELGNYQVSLLSATGVLIRERVVEVTSPAQVDVWEVPVGAAAGVYIIRAVQQTRAVRYTTKLVVE